MKIEPGMLCWIGWGPNEALHPVGAVTDPRCKRGRVREESFFLEDYWVVNMEDGEVWEVQSCFIIPIPPDEETRDRETEKEENKECTI